jgi:soluble lytic murein transglycosylase-like protein
MIAFWPWQTQLPLARTVASRYGVPLELVLAVMGVESSFDPRAYRAEPQIGDASRGLMQLLLGTARGLGFTGPEDGLYVPATNADLGTRLLRDNLRARGGDIAKAVSQYNGGYRPQYGLGEPYASGPNAGRFGNQAHVDKVLAAMQEFRVALAPSAPAPPPAPYGGVPAAPEAPGSPIVWIVTLAALAGAIALLAGARAP